jgi:hypothetical protein
MSPPRLHLSERTQVAGILVLALGGLFAIVYFLLLPQYEARREIRALRAKLEADKSYHQSEATLRKAMELESNNTARIEAEWGRTVERLATFANQASLRRIDYKVELFRTRKSLVAKSEALGIQLIDPSLGIDDALKDQDKVRERMLQLKAVEKLADLTLDRRIERLTAILPLPPVAHRAPDGRPCFTEYPVRVECDVPFDNLYALFQSVFEENRVFAFRNLRIESGPRANAPVRVTAVMSALVFE